MQIFGLSIQKANKQVTRSYCPTETPEALAAKVLWLNGGTDSGMTEQQYARWEDGQDPFCDGEAALARIRAARTADLPFVPRGGMYGVEQDPQANGWDAGAAGDL